MTLEKVSCLLLPIKQKDIRCIVKYYHFILCDYEKRGEEMPLL